MLLEHRPFHLFIYFERDIPAVVRKCILGGKRKYGELVKLMRLEGIPNVGIDRQNRNLASSKGK